MRPLYAFTSTFLVYRVQNWKISPKRIRIWCCCRNVSGFLKEHGIRGRVSPDNARAAREVAEIGDLHSAALASELAAEIYDLNVLARHIEDNDDNTTRFLVMSQEADLSRRGEYGMITSFVFQVRNIPAALYKAMGGFATNGINMTKLESYMVDGSFTATQFYADHRWSSRRP